jgi:HSP20 family protein
MTESESEFTLSLDVPGVDRGTLELDLDGEYLSIRGERPAPMQDETHKVLLTEAPCGTFHRRFRLGAGLDRDAIRAEYRDGLLEISVPKREEARPRRIPVSTGA